MGADRLVGWQGINWPRRSKEQQIYTQPALTLNSARVTELPEFGVISGSCGTLSHFLFTVGGVAAPSQSVTFAFSFNQT